MVILILLFNSLIMYEQVMPYLVALVGVREQVFIKSLDLEYYLTTYTYYNHYGELRL
jgi:hypothetical protein